MINYKKKLIIGKSSQYLLRTREGGRNSKHPIAKKEYTLLKHDVLETEIR